MSESTLGNFMGGILAAMVRADAQAAISTLEFIERIGFEEGARGEDGQIRRLGRMRMVTFDYMRSDFHGRTEKRVLRLPLLSLVPIPMLHVAEGEFEFEARVERLDAPEVSPGLLSMTNAILPAPRIVAHVAPATPGPQAAAKPPEQKSESRLGVKVKMRRGDLPGGLVSILGIMGSLPHAGPGTEPPAPAPPPKSGGGGGDAPMAAAMAATMAAAPAATATATAEPAPAAPPPPDESPDATPEAAFEAEPGESYDDFSKRFAERRRLRIQEARTRAERFLNAIRRTKEPE